MNELAKVIATIEVATRYLLTGAVVSAVFTLGMPDYRHWFAWAAENEPATAAMIAVSGFVAFTSYRVVLWTLGDALAWRAGWSVPSLLHRKGVAYDKPYVHFLRWRYSNVINDALGGYLTFRWTVAHLASVSGIALLFASFPHQDNSWVSEHYVFLTSAGAASLCLGLWQCAFFYRAERDLCTTRRGIVRRRKTVSNRRFQPTNKRVKNFENSKHPLAPLAPRAAP